MKWNCKKMENNRGGLRMLEAQGPKKLKRAPRAMFYAEEHQPAESCDVFMVKQGTSSHFVHWKGSYHVFPTIKASKRELSLHCL